MEPTDLSIPNFLIVSHHEIFFVLRPTTSLSLWNLARFYSLRLQINFLGKAWYGCSLCHLIQVIFIVTCSSLETTLVTRHQILFRPFPHCVLTKERSPAHSGHGNSARILKAQSRLSINTCGRDKLGLLYTWHFPLVNSINSRINPLKTCLRILII